MKWKRRTDYYGDTDYTCGNWTIRKEYYANGVSLYDWMLYNDGNSIDSFARLRDAKAAAEKLAEKWAAA